MALITSELKKIYEEDVSANGSVSEAFFLKLAASLNGVIDNALWAIGDIRTSCLSEAQFAAQNGYSASAAESSKRWVLIKGQSIAGSKLSTLYGISTLPSAVSNGAHLEQANGSIFQFLASQNKSHNHSGSFVASYPTIDGGPSSAPRYTPYGEYGSAWPVTISNSGSDVARPNSITVNFFLKIND